MSDHATRPRAVIAPRSDLPVVVQELQTMIEGLAEFAAIVGFDDTIMLTNHSWDRELDRRGTSDFRVGCSYPGALASLVDGGDLQAKPILDAFHDISAGVRRSFQHSYFGSGIFSEHDYRIRLSAFHICDRDYVLVSIQDVTEFNRLRRQRRRFDSGVLKAQEDERRRIARELHDSTSQQLVVLQFNLMNLGQRRGSEAEDLLSECKNVVKDIQREIRSFSYIAHPPSLSLNGLAGAVETLAAGFAFRVGLKVDLQISDVGEASASVEAAIYRLVQEALSNVHRHASASGAMVRLVGTDRYIHLVVSDDGTGFDIHKVRHGASVGVGILGMEERVRELGGRFSIRRIEERTVLSASLPRSKSDAAE